MCSVYEQDIKSEPEESEIESDLSDPSSEPAQQLEDESEMLYKFYTASKREWDQYFWSTYKRTFALSHDVQRIIKNYTPRNLTMQIEDRRRFMRQPNMLINLS